VKLCRTSLNLSGPCQTPCQPPYSPRRHSCIQVQKTGGQGYCKVGQLGVLLSSCRVKKRDYPSTQAAQRGQDQGEGRRQNASAMGGLGNVSSATAGSLTSICEGSSDVDSQGGSPPAHPKLSLSSFPSLVLVDPSSYHKGNLQGGRPPLEHPKLSPTSLPSVDLAESAHMEFTDAHEHTL
jgi:hypothetical protein